MDSAEKTISYEQNALASLEEDMLQFALEIGTVGPIQLHFNLDEDGMCIDP